MSQETINFRDCHTAADLLDALHTLIEDAGLTGNKERDAEVIYTNPTRVTLYEETLSDGSIVKNIRVALI